MVFGCEDLNGVNMINKVHQNIKFSGVRTKDLSNFKICLYRGVPGSPLFSPLNRGNKIPPVISLHSVLFFYFLQLSCTTKLISF